MDYISAALEMGFSVAGDVNTDFIECEEDIRALCAPDKCPNYGSGWICPPGCGSVENCRGIVQRYKNALLLQSISENVDMSRGEELQRLAETHNRLAAELFVRIRIEQGDAYLLTTGGCALCEKCSYPDEPCRFPDKNRGSLSAFGINVEKLCKKAGIEYSFIPSVVRLIACVLY